MPFLVMELFPGEDLGKRLMRFGRLPPSEVVTYLYQAALALEKTQKAGIIHRDLKPSNIFLVERDDEPPYIKLLDFGVSKVLADGKTSGTTSMGVGTPSYMAPEQTRTPGSRQPYTSTRWA
jgi:serine/threonine-protein kinase